MTTHSNVLHLEAQRSDRIASEPNSAPINSNLKLVSTADCESSDEELVCQLKIRNKDALAFLFRRYARMARAVSFRVLRNAAEADDLVQEIFLYLFRKADTFDPDRGTVRSWIVRVTYHRAIERRRYLASRRFYTGIDIESHEAQSELGHETDFYEESMEGRFGKENLKQMIGLLSPDQREVLHLYFYEGYTIEEIARQLALTAGNVRNHYYRGLERMRKQLFQTALKVK
jgi:RNA polymerase sigma-70 factor, ECF subfamily